MRKRLSALLLSAAMVSGSQGVRRCRPDAPIETSCRPTRPIRRRADDVEDGRNDRQIRCIDRGSCRCRPRTAPCRFRSQRRHAFARAGTRSIRRSSRNCRVSRENSVFGIRWQEDRRIDSCVRKEREGRAMSSRVLSSSMTILRRRNRSSACWRAAGTTSGPRAMPTRRSRASVPGARPLSSPTRKMPLVDGIRSVPTGSGDLERPDHRRVRQQRRTVGNRARSTQGLTTTS